MPMKSKAQLALEAEEAQLVAALKEIAYNPAKPDYVRNRAMSTLRAIQKVEAKKLAAKQAKVAARRNARTAARAQEAMKVALAHHLPDNGRLERYVPPARRAPIAPPDAGWPDLSGQGRG